MITSIALIEKFDPMMVDRRNDSKAQVESLQMTDLVPIGMRRLGSCEKAERHGHALSGAT
jgi:hypothetical protein